MTTYEYGATTISKRRRLPHYDVHEGLYLVTWRLHDAVPLRRLAPLLQQRDGSKAAERRYRAAVELLLDESHGTCVLLDAALASIVHDALAFFDGDRYSLIAWAIMPNHVHVVIRLIAEHHLDRVLHSLKSFTSQAINARLARRGSLWQSEYFDVTIRSPRHLETATTYVISNPEKAGLRDYEWAGMNAAAYAALL
ncbi:MAG TPA: transposase [Thermoanaerobaculia bacterium]|nr:transposase [Thermoanaerobaculia bacterium]